MKATKKKKAINKTNVPPTPTLEELKEQRKQAAAVKDFAKLKEIKRQMEALTAGKEDIAALEAQQQRAMDAEDFDLAEELENKIQALKASPGTSNDEIAKLKEEQDRAMEADDFDLAENLEHRIQELTARAQEDKQKQAKEEITSNQPDDESIDENKFYALKQMKLTTPKAKAMAEKEARLLERLKHKNIIAYEESFYFEDLFYIACAFANGGDLEHAIAKQKERLMEGRMEWDTALVSEWFEQIALAMQCVHNVVTDDGKGMLHRDLKPANILICIVPGLQYPQLQVTDFGLGRTMEDSHANAETQCGTRLYMSPEAQDGEYSYPTDVFSMGCVYFELCTAQRAFKKCADILDMKHANDPSRIPSIGAKHRLRCCPNFKDIALLNEIIQECLHYEPMCRPKCNDEDLISKIRDIKKLCVDIPTDGSQEHEAAQSSSWNFDSMSSLRDTSMNSVAAFGSTMPNKDTASVIAAVSQGPTKIEKGTLVYVAKPSEKVHAKIDGNLTPHTVWNDEWTGAKGKADKTSAVQSGAWWVKLDGKRVDLLLAPSQLALQHPATGTKDDITFSSMVLDSTMDSTLQSSLSPGSSTQSMFRPDSELDSALVSEMPTAGPKLSPGWREQTAPDGSTYYENTASGSTTFDKPIDGMMCVVKSTQGFPETRNFNIFFGQGGNNFNMITGLVPGGWAEKHTDLGKYIGGRIVKINSAKFTTFEDLEKIKKSLSTDGPIVFTVQKTSHEVKAKAGFPSNKRFGFVLDYYQRLELTSFAEDSWTKKHTNLPDYIGWCITRINGIEIKTPEEMDTFKNGCNPGDQIVFTVTKKKKRLVPHRFVRVGGLKGDEWSRLNGLWGTTIRKQDEQTNGDESWIVQFHKPFLHPVTKKQSTEMAISDKYLENNGSAVPVNVTAGQHFRVPVMFGTRVLIPKDKSICRNPPRNKYGVVQPTISFKKVYNGDRHNINWADPKLQPVFGKQGTIVQRPPLSMGTTTEGWSWISFPDGDGVFWPDMGIQPIIEWVVQGSKVTIRQPSNESDGFLISATDGKLDQTKWTDHIAKQYIGKTGFVNYQATSSKTKVPMDFFWIVFPGQNMNQIVVHAHMLQTHADWTPLSSKSSSSGCESFNPIDQFERPPICEFQGCGKLMTLQSGGYIQNDGGSWSCGRCKRSHPMTTARYFCCPQHNSDTCLSCAGFKKNFHGPNCKCGEPMKSDSTRSWRCDVCQDAGQRSGFVPPDFPHYSCAKCNFDVCLHCANATCATQSIQPTSIENIRIRIPNSKFPRDTFQVAHKGKVMTATVPGGNCCPRHINIQI